MAINLLDPTAQQRLGKLPTLPGQTQTVQPGMPVSLAPMTQTVGTMLNATGTVPRPPDPSGTLPQTPTTFGPGNNLINQQLAPPNSPDTQAARGFVGQQLGSLQGPDRGALAQQTFQQLQSLSEPQYQQSLRQVGQKAAALGRLGAGMTTSELGDVASNRQKYLGTLQQQLATEAAGQTLQDRLGVLGAGQGVLGQLSGLDQQQYGNLTNERGYQAGLEDQGFQRQQQLTQLLAQLGFGGNNQALQQLIAGQYANQASGAQANTGELLKQLFATPKKG